MDLEVEEVENLNGFPKRAFWMDTARGSPLCGVTLCPQLITVTPDLSPRFSHLNAVNASLTLAHVLRIVLDGGRGAQGGYLSRKKTPSRRHLLSPCSHPSQGLGQIGCRTSHQTSCWHDLLVRSLTVSFSLIFPNHPTDSDMMC